MSITFRAGVQYGDLKGSASADNADMTDAFKFLKEKGYITNGEFVVGVSLWVGENHGRHEDPVSVRFYITDLGGHANIPEKLENSNDPVPLKEISMDMDIADFLALFKRFSVTLSNGGLLEGREIDK
ncbi:MAG: hypothetical protein WD005_00750 [Haliea sp.]